MELINQVNGIVLWMYCYTKDFFSETLGFLLYLYVDVLHERNSNESSEWNSSLHTPLQCFISEIEENVNAFALM